MKRFLYFFCCIALIVTFCSCDLEDVEDVQNTRLYKNSIIELTDGWYLFYDYEEVYRADGTLDTIYSAVDGINLKKNDIPGFNVAIIDKQTGEITDYITPAVNTMRMNKKYEKILNKLSDYLGKRKYSYELAEEELEFTDSEMLFDKQDIVSVYNKAMKNDTVEFGKYLYISSYDIKKEAVLGDYSWQIGYCVLCGNISAINIELIYTDGKYLSDIPTENLTSEQTILKSTIESIEKNIIDKQSFLEMGISAHKEINGVKFSRLSYLLEAIETENEVNGQNND